MGRSEEKSNLILILIMQNYFGLTSKEAKELLKKHGYNEIKGRSSVNPLKLLFKQFLSPLMAVLIIAALVSWGIGFLPGQESHGVDTVLILLIVFFSGMAGFIQEYKSEKTVQSLQKMANPEVMVFRDGERKEILARNLVPGDLILFEQGDLIPADARINKTNSLLRINESILTGESQAVTRKEREEIYRGTSVDMGSGSAIVIKTGMETHLGSIADNLQSMKDEETSFQREIKEFSHRIIIILIVFILIFTGISIIKYNLYQSILISISLAVAAIPEGMPAVLAIVLSMGARGMAKRNALVKKLSAVESTGAIEVICTDKTGTLTENEMTVRELSFNKKEFKFYNSKKISNQDKEEIEPLLKCALLCNNVKFGRDRNEKKALLGDQTEIALVKFAEKIGFKLDKVRKDFTKLNEIPFNSERKMMSVIYGEKNNVKKQTMYVKGAPEVVMEKCTSFYLNGKKRL